MVWFEIRKRLALIFAGTECIFTLAEFEFERLKIIDKWQARFKV